MKHQGIRLSSAIAAPLSFLKDRPVLYRGDRFQIVGYGVFATLNAVAVTSMTVYFLYLKGVSLDANMALVFPVIAFGIWLGSKVMHLAALGRKLLSNPIKYVSETGFYVQGGILGSLLVSALIAPLLGVPTIFFWDGLAWGGLLGLFFGRLGCFNYGCCYGRRTHDHAGGVCYTNPETKILRLHPELKGVRVHPSQLYTAFSHLLVFALVTAALSVWTIPNGFLAAGFLIYHGLSRVGFERFRGDLFFHEGRNWTTFRTAGAMVLFGISLLAIGPVLFDAFGLLTAPVHPVSILTFLSMFITAPLMLVSTVALSAFILVGFGIHGRKLGTFPWSPENRRHDHISTSVAPSTIPTVE